MVQPRNLSFGPFEFQPGTGRLTKLGYPVKLQPKAAVILSCLLERRGEVVTRAQLQERLWPAGIHVDFELGIKVAMNKLRDALGDLSEDPVYIQTVYGEGYRFIAPVVQPAHSEEEAVPMPVAEEPSSIGRKVRWAGAVASVTAAITLALIIQMTASTSPLHFQNRDWVVIATFENPTGEKVLDGSMESALERELSLSSSVNVVQRDRVVETLKLMRQSPTAVLNEDLARQVAIRDGGIKAVLAGRVEKFGQKYSLTVRVLNPADGGAVAVFKSDASQDQLTERAVSIANEIRRKLGERAPDSSAPQATRLEKATTSSLTALRVFSLGMTNVNQFKWEAAAGLLEEATRDDPQFALAHIYAAQCYLNSRQSDRAAPHFDAAFRLASGVSQRERLFILGSYYQGFLHDDRRALPSYEALTNLYPDDYWGVNNLTVTYQNLGMRRESFEAAKRLLAIRPNRDRKIQGKILAWDIALETASDRWKTGDVKGAAQEVARVSAHAMAQGDDYYVFFLANANLTLGRIAATKELCGPMGNVLLRRECLLRVAYMGGDRNLAKELLSQIRTGSRDPTGVKQEAGTR